MFGFDAGGIRDSLIYFVSALIIWAACTGRLDAPKWPRRPHTEPRKPLRPDEDEIIDQAGFAPQHNGGAKRSAQRTRYRKE